MKNSLVFSVFLSISALCYGQGNTAEQQPLLIEMLEVPNSLDRRPQLTVLSDRPIRAYVLVVEFLRDNKPSMTFAITQARFQENPWNKGQVIQSNNVTAPVDAEGQPLSVRTSLDLVVFNDGSVWGPQRRKESSRTLGRIEGTRIYHNRLKEVLDKQGVSAVVGLLNAPN